MIKLYPVIWAAVTLSSILAMPAFSAETKPAAPAAKPANKPAVAATKPATATVAVKPAETPKPAVAATKPAPQPAAAKPATSAAEVKPKAEAPKLDANGKPVAQAPKKNDSIKKRPFLVQHCAHKVHGTYVFGRAPYGCDSSSWEDTSDVQNNMNALIFNEKKSQKQEVTRYTTEMYRFARDAADEFMNKRNPNASKAEKEAFRKGVMALMHQESFWSHYRVAGTDGRLKTMKGDQDWSFGMMQIHGRWHKDMLEKYQGWTLKGNLAYGMDMYYSAWQKAKGASCVKNFDHRARAAYSVYNAGGWATCRWTNPDDKWARNDKGFYEKYAGQLWNKLIDKSAIASTPSPVKMACTLDTGGADCKSEAKTETKTESKTETKPVAKAEAAKPEIKKAQ